MAKDPAAVALGKKRWKGKTDEEKLAHALMMNEKRTGATSSAQRSESASKAAQARWAKEKAAQKAGKKK